MLKNILLALCLIMSPLAFSGEESHHSHSIKIDSIQLKEVSKTKYYLGGVLGTLPGFGIGHAVQGRWKEKGWIFTAGELTTAAGALYFAIKSMSSAPTAKEIVDNYSKDPSATNIKGLLTNGLVSLLFLAFFLSFKVVETVDIWSFSSHHLYKVAEQKAFQISPSYYSYKSKDIIGPSLNLKW